MKQNLLMPGLIMPVSLDLTPTNKLVLKIPEIGERGYGENRECFLTLTFNRSRLFIDYDVDDDTKLSDHWGHDEYELAHGDLKEETFEEIQKRALLVILQHLQYPKQAKNLLEGLNQLEKELNAKPQTP